MTERATESPLRVLSYGGGTQSSGLALMSLTCELERLDAIVSADTRYEMPATYTYVELISNLADEAGVPFVWASAGDLKQTLVDRRGRGMQPNLPVRVRDPRGQLQRVNAYRCSYDFERRVIAQAVKKLCGRPAARAPGSGPT